MLHFFFGTTLAQLSQCTGSALVELAPGCPDFSGTWTTGAFFPRAEVVLSQTGCTGEARLPTNNELLWTYSVENSDLMVTGADGPAATIITNNNSRGNFVFTEGRAGCCHILWDADCVEGLCGEQILLDSNAAR